VQAKRHLRKTNYETENEGRIKALIEEPTGLRWRRGGKESSGKKRREKLHVRGVVAMKKRERPEARKSAPPAENFSPYTRQFLTGGKKKKKRQKKQKKKKKKKIERRGDTTSSEGPPGSNKGEATMQDLGLQGAP